MYAWPHYFSGDSRDLESIAERVETAARTSFETVSSRTDSVRTSSPTTTTARSSNGRLPAVTTIPKPGPRRHLGSRQLLHSCKYRWLHAPATNMALSRGTCRTTRLSASFPVPIICRKRAARVESRSDRGARAGIWRCSACSALKSLPWLANPSRQVRCSQQ